MKRSPLKRRKRLESKSGFERSGSLRRTPLRKVSKKKREEIDELKPVRDFVRNCFCANCLTKQSDHVHEIVAGSGRHKSIRNYLTLLGVCWRCHEEIQGIAFWKQWKVKIRAVAHGINECADYKAISDELVAEVLEFIERRMSDD